MQTVDVAGRTLKFTPELWCCYRDFSEGEKGKFCVTCLKKKKKKALFSANKGFAFSLNLWPFLNRTDTYEKMLIWQHHGQKEY